MRRTIKAKSTRVPLRKTALTASAAARRSYPAWVDAAEGMAFSVAVPRVRDALVLRLVVSRKRPAGKGSSHATGAR